MTDREKLPSGDVVAYMWTDPTHQRPPELHWHCDMGAPYEGWIATPLSAMPDRQAGINEGLEVAAKVVQTVQPKGMLDEEESLTIDDLKEEMINAIRAMKVEK